MGAGIVLIAVLIIAGIVAWLLLSGAAVTKSVEEGADAGDLQRAPDTLRYTPPRGQDPAVLIAALESAGFPAEPHSGEMTGRVVIECRNGVERDRERVREVLASANTTSLADGVPVNADVRFDDE